MLMYILDLKPRALWLFSFDRELKRLCNKFQGMDNVRLTIYLSKASVFGLCVLFA